MEKNIEEQLLANGTDLKSHVVKIAHHGSDTSSSEEFLKKINPDIAVISVGKDNKFNHPNGRILNRLERLNLKIFRTDLHGGLNFVSDGVKIYKN
jgi:beta-lactamase superfamily II metal-dependent hydrolase